MKTLQELRDLVAKLQSELATGAVEIRSLADVPDITPEDDTKLTGLLEARTAKKVELDEARAELATAEARAAAIDEARRQATDSIPGVPDFQHKRGIDTDPNLRYATHEEVRSAALKVVEGRGKDFLSPRQQEHFERLVGQRSYEMDGGLVSRLTIVTESEDYRSAFLKAMTQPNPLFSPEELRAVNRYRDEFRAMNEGTGSAGGFGIPVLIDPTIIISSGALDSPILNICTIKTITTDAWKGVTSPGATWQYQAEAAAASDGSPTLAQPNIPVYKADGFLPYSIEVEQDYPGFAAEMAKVLGQGYIDLLAPALAAGTGSNQPTGVFTHMVNTTAAPAHVTVTTKGTLAAVDIRAAWNAMPERFRPRATWFMNTEVQSLIEALGNNLSLADFTANLGGSAPSQLEGKPIVLSDYAPSFTNTTGTESVLVVGDFSQYFVIQRAGMTVELVNHLFDQATARPTGQRGWYAMARHGADVVNANAFRLLANS